MHVTRSSTAPPRAAHLEWPFVERRKADRRQRDRRLPSKLDDALRACTERERQILRLVVAGLTNKEIAHRLAIAEDTVKKHLWHAYSKLGIRRRALLILEQVARVRRKRT